MIRAEFSAGGHRASIWLRWRSMKRFGTLSLIRKYDDWWHRTEVVQTNQWIKNNANAERAFRASSCNRKCVSYSGKVTGQVVPKQDAVAL